MGARYPRNSQNVPAFLKRILDVANYRITEYGTINPFKIAAAAQEKKEKERLESIRAKSSGIQTIEGKISPGHSTQYAIDGCDIHIGSDTMVVGDLSIGTQVRVKLGMGGKAKTVVVTGNSFSA